VERLDLLKELEKLANGNSLNADEIRLYLLLLANCRGSLDGRIEYNTIKNAIGREFTPGKLKKACQQLLMDKFIAVTSILPDGINEENFILSYTIFPTGEN